MDPIVNQQLADSLANLITRLLNQATVGSIPAASDNTAGLVKIINNLTTSDVNSALTAEQGRVLKQLLDNLGITNIAGLTIARSVGGAVSNQLQVSTGGNLRPWSDGGQWLGDPSFRWAQVYSSSGSINTSDAREKTAVRDFTSDELSAAKALSKEIGIFKFLSMVEDKGDSARDHIGMTVQRAIEIMEEHNLDPYNYGFICYDEWDDLYETVEEIPETPSYPETRDDEGNVLTEAIEGQPGIPGGERLIRPAGDRYSFRTDELLMFICKGFEARLSALESL